MFQVEITKDIFDSAVDRAKSLGELNNSITHGQGNLAGYIGEELCKRWMFGEIVDTYDYDLVVQNIKYDVKTKRCTSKSKPFYDCSIAKFNTRQRCDRYVFVRVLFKDGKFPGQAWILGEKDKTEYFNQARYLRKGQIDPANNFVVKADCYNMAIKNLDPIDMVKNA